MRFVACLACAPVLLGSRRQCANDNAQLRQEVEQLKKTLAGLEQRLAAQEKKLTTSVPCGTSRHHSTTEAAPTTIDLQAQVKDLDERVQRTEMHTALDR